MSETFKGAIEERVVVSLNGIFITPKNAKVRGGNYVFPSIDSSSTLMFYLAVQPLLFL